CDICELSYKSKKELDGHMKKSLVHPKCGKCQQGFADQETLQLVSLLDAAEYRVLSRSGSLTKSPAYTYSASFREHQKACHLEGYCSGCDLWYPSKQQLQKHFYNSYSHSHCVECEVGF
ncbi:hypothetical protein FOMPIDRAFT_8867, partial [Fomitopsis schrenkii]